MMIDGIRRKAGSKANFEAILIEWCDIWARGYEKIEYIDDGNYEIYLTYEGKEYSFGELRYNRFEDWATKRLKK